MDIGFYGWLLEKLPKELTKTMKEKYLEEKRPKMNYRSNEIDCWIMIACHLNVRDLLKIAEVCKDWYRWSRSDICWEYHRQRILNSFPEMIYVLDRNSFGNSLTTKYIDMIPELKNGEDEVKRKVFRTVKGTWYLFAKILLPSCRYVIKKKNRVAIYKALARTYFIQGNIKIKSIISTGDKKFNVFTCDGQRCLLHFEEKFIWLEIEHYREFFERPIPIEEFRRIILDV